MLLTAWGQRDSEADRPEGMTQLVGGEDKKNTPDAGDGAVAQVTGYIRGSEKS